ncbi:hypothetical protein [Pseudoalteromonas luteoviolacea]|uniref:hypothetical protein n=1 Tax=Pseudoalteromonas luteoviolacea TaxID=43657 RepID=UPI001152479F|nr:hypothetical protein [Pseudoalteromonas luteoviolacea]TQF72440.1 hypothetical protein FLM44_15905 [Pseudoalteromonas luteoviolacea]
MKRKNVRLSTWLMILGFAMNGAVYAEAQSNTLSHEFSGSVLFSDQFMPNGQRTEAAYSDEVVREKLYSVDLESTVRKGSNSVFMWLEYSRNPLDNGISSLFANTNEDAGTTEDGAGTSRLQVSSLYWQYALPDNMSSVLLGLAEVSMLVDTNDVANDEVGQFMAAGFVNNPGIDFPDYAPAIRYQGMSADEKWQWRALLSTAKGLADNGGNYTDTLSQIDGGEGIFSALEGQRQLANMTTLTLGSWHNSDTKRHGVYSAIYKQLGNLQLHSRLSHSRSYKSIVIEEDTPPSQTQFASLVAEYKYQAFTFASGMSYLSHEWTDGSSVNTRMAECYVQYNWTKHLHMTFATQWHDGVINDDIKQPISANWQNVMSLRTVLYW